MSDAPRIDLVDDPAALGPALDAIHDEVVGADVERADSDRYHRRAALVQVGDADVCVLVDPLAIPDPAPLRELCRDRFVVLHAIENDLAPLEALGVELPAVADTAVAAAFLGLPIGLGDLLSSVLDLELDTNKSKYQRADWEQRPLSQGMIEYAAGDVLFLPELWRELDHRLRERDRFAWYEQELAATIELARRDTRHWDRTKGSGRLAPEQRAVLRSLWEAREAICVEHDIAPNRLLHDKTLLSLAQEPAGSPEALVQRDKQRRRGPVTDHADELFDAQQRGLEAEPEPRPTAKRWSDHQRDAFDAMRRLRSSLAADLDLDAGFACPSRQLRAAVTAEPGSPGELAAAADLRPWQREVFLDGLWGAWEEAAETADAVQPSTG